jgi:hypothetical protein
MDTLNLKRLWEVMNTISFAQGKLSDEQDKWVNLLGYNSEYCSSSFEQFLEYYSFRISKDSIVVYNNDPIPYEDFRTEDFSYVPICLLSFSAEKVQKWVEEEIEKQLKQQEDEKLEEKERLKREIERLQKQLEKL